MIYLICTLSLLFFSGCASEQAYKDYTLAYSGYIQTSNRFANSGKLVEMVAIDGQNIELKGVKSFTVYAPSKTDDGVKPPEQVRQSEWVGTVNNLFSAASSFGMAAVIGNAVKGVVSIATTGAGHNTTTTTSNANQSTTSTSSIDSHNTSTDSHNTTTTTSTTDSHNTDSHNTDNHTITNPPVAP